MHTIAFNCWKDVLKGRLSTARLSILSLLFIWRPSTPHPSRVTTSSAFPWPAHGPDLLNNKCSVSHNYAPAKKKKNPLYHAKFKPSSRFTRMPVFQHNEFLEETIIKVVQTVYSHHIYITFFEELYWEKCCPWRLCCHPSFCRAPPPPCLPPLQSKKFCRMLAIIHKATSKLWLILLAW